MVTPQRRYSAAEQQLDRIVHWFGVAAAVAAVTVLVWLALGHGGALLMGSVVLYGLGLVGMLVCSALCNHDLANQSPHTELFRRLDHSAIFVMIAGTYTPFTVVVMGGAWGWGLFSFVWILAFAGIWMRMTTAGPLRPTLYISLYLLMGWSITAAIKPLLSVAPVAMLVLIFVGGLLYSLGVVFYVSRAITHHRAIWHGFVIAAACCHYAAIVMAVLLQE